VITIKGHLEYITYHNPENHFMIARLRPDQTDSAITILGHLAGVRPGEDLSVNGNWETHPKYGQQFRITSFEITLPSTLDGIRKYLQSGMIKGLGPKLAERVVNRFGERTLAVIETDPDRLQEIEGVGEKKAALISAAWKDHHAVRTLMTFLQEVGVKAAHGARLMRLYGSDAQTIVQEDPYRLAMDMPGTGFYIADAIARHTGVPEDDPDRIDACIIHELGQSVREGHTYTHLDRLIEHNHKFFRIEEKLLMQGIKRLEEQFEIEVETGADGESDRVYLKNLHQAECGIAGRIAALMSVPVSVPHIDAEQITNQVFHKLALKPSEEQIAVLGDILSQRVAVITGGPGTGKTTLIRSIAALFETLGQEIALATPTGRAARRLSEVTHRKAVTIHKLLGYNLNEQIFEKNRDNPVEADVIIVDETSMVDTLLMYHLTMALSPIAALILVGDIFQLPSVGPGNVLADMIASRRIKAYELTKIFRQDRESPIVLNAHRVREGQFPQFDPPEDPEGLSEFYYIQQGNPERVVKTIVELCSKLIPEKFNIDAVRDIQVLTPMHKGTVGTINLNSALQKALNPNKGANGSKGIGFKPGDKVMHLKNNYQKDVYNGDIGVVKAVDPEDQILSVDFYGRSVVYDYSELDELTLAYAISVHKSQGSEYPVVIVPLLTQHYILLQRNLLYTAITRGKKLVILIGTRKALEVALNNEKPLTRYSCLAERLKLSLPDIGTAMFAAG
jgi:exodeoxyribonuclease V alpha subunit